MNHFRFVIENAPWGPHTQVFLNDEEIKDVRTVSVTTDPHGDQWVDIAFFPEDKPDIRYPADSVTFEDMR